MTLCMSLYFHLLVTINKVVRKKRQNNVNLQGKIDEPLWKTYPTISYQHSYIIYFQNLSRYSINLCYIKKTKKNITFFGVSMNMFPLRLYFPLSSTKTVLIEGWETK